MKRILIIKCVVAAIFSTMAIDVSAHIVLAEKTAPAGSSYKAVFLVGHGCEGSATTGITVQIPTGFKGAKPMPKAGWAVSTKVEKLARPYDSYGKQITEAVTEIAWTASNRDAVLADAHYDEFVLRGVLPDTEGPIWFKVLQTCEKGRNDWSQIPASGTSTKGMKTPAVLLEVIPATGPAHQH